MLSARVERAARVEGVAAAPDHVRRERDVGGHDQVAGLHLLDDLAVGDVEAMRNLHRPDEWRRRDPQELVGDEDHPGPSPLGGAVQNLLDHLGAGIGVDPDLHAISSYSGSVPTGSRSKAAARSARVYGCSGAARTRAVAPRSTTRPACMTISSSASALTTRRSWLMKR